MSFPKLILSIVNGLVHDLRIQIQNYSKMLTARRSVDQCL